MAIWTEPDVTSYDYDALLTEDGRITPKYKEYQKVIGKYMALPEVHLSCHIERRAYGTFGVTRTADLFQNLDNLTAPVENLYPVCMEKLNQGYGYILYESNLPELKRLEKVRLWKANDRANIFLDEKPVLTLYDRELLSGHELKNAVCSNGKLDILMENMGRVNFTPIMEEQRKGIDGGVQVNDRLHFGWTIYPLPMEDLTNVDFGVPAKTGLPGFYEFQFEIDDPADTFLDTDGWGKGIVFVNHFNIGRFWEIGPQKRLYVPGPLLKKGKNTLVIFETEGKVSGSIQFYDEPEI